MKANARDAILVSWISVNHRAAPFLTALRDSSSHLRSRVQRLYLCFRDAPHADGEREREALRETERDLKSQLGSHCPEIVKIPWKTRSSPTDHAAIRTFAEEALKSIRDACPDAPITIHLSPGTPAMHAVWLALGTTGVIDGSVDFIQTGDERARTAGQPAVQLVSFELDTWLRRYRSAIPLRTVGADAHEWDPARVKSPALRLALSQLKEWAPLRVPVLLIGERGTGKTTLANFLRAMSPFQRAKTTSWPTVVCGQFRVNPELARSELFGHAKGAFTGATGDRVGLLEQAQDDTLFFDEIADIDRDTQRLLMAAVEARGFQRLGEGKVRHSNFRLVSATNRPLAELRELLDPDFFDRIAVFVLDVPPLRKCAEDLPNAWRHVLEEARHTARVSPEGWEGFVEHPKLLAAITAHPLPGNFRDLQRAAYHLLASMVARRSEASILSDAIAALGPLEVHPLTTLKSSELVARLPITDLRGSLVAHERAWLEAALLKAAGNKSEAARLLGIARKTYEHRLRKAQE